MKFTLFSLLLSSIVALFVNLPAVNAGQDNDLVLWYNRPAAVWTEALPVGNGRLGAMIFGGRRRSAEAEDFSLDEKLSLNEDSFWTGRPYDPNRQDAWKHLAEARRLIFANELAKAHILLDEKAMAKPLRQMAYQPVGDLNLKFPQHRGQKIQAYRRDLDLDRAIATTSYVVGGVRYQHEVFCSTVDQVLVFQITADKPKSVNFSVSLTSPHEKIENRREESGLSLTAFGPARLGIPGGLRCYVKLLAQTTGGKIEYTPNEQPTPEVINIANADSAVLLLAADTNFVDYQDISGDPESVVADQLTAAAQKDVDVLRRAHITAHQQTFRRVQLDVGTSDAINKPTNQRIKDFGQGDDPQLAELFFQYGRYLLLASSQPGSRPANLQGIWNDKLNPPWESKYTCNINVEMNYWPAESTNLAECHEPLLAMIEQLAESGQRTAKAHYNAGGWTSHHNTDLWLASAPIDGPAWGYWPTGGAWLCQHLWYHYEYTQDDEFLKRIYPVLKGSAQFFLDTLVEDPNTGYLVTCPSISPENRRLHAKGARGGVSICAGPTCDVQLLNDLFSHCQQAAEILAIDSEFQQQLKTTQWQFPPLQIGHVGQLQEWQDDYDLSVPEKRHRHVSHLYGLFPSDQITSQRTPKLFAAARKSLELRGDGGTGWAKAWKINLWAHLLEGDRAYRLLESLLTTGTYPNLFDAHPPFQIDGNFGATSGIAEMLLQTYYHHDQEPSCEIQLLPALPSRWPQGLVTGLRTRGGYEVDIAWQAGKLTRVKLRSRAGLPATVKYGQASQAIDIAAGEVIVLGESDFN